MIFQPGMNSRANTLVRLRGQVRRLLSLSAQADVVFQRGTSFPVLREARA